jgi:chromatin remodeling complex protein RSC6
MAQITQMTTDDLDKQFAELYAHVNSFSKNVKVVQDELRVLSKVFKVVDKQTKQRRKKPQAKLSLSSDLENFLSLDHGTHATKAEVMKMVSSYIKEKNLQVQTDKRRFLPNKELSKIFNVKKPVDMTFVEINKHISHHLTKLG